ncbi:hypothetical protein EZS27_008778 [termite gut metagenome]|uniref:Transposase IS4-like domain-containing protein n=1 Tax=termite gut metagenome TaxID=433724 RepID=A0A5J4SDQ8_9ZZZZ
MCFRTVNLSEIKAIQVLIIRQICLIKGKLSLAYLLVTTCLVKVEQSKSKRQKRKRIETLFSQYKGQFSMNINFAKTFVGLATRILSKITALLMIQYSNVFVLNRKIDGIKRNIC